MNASLLVVDDDPSYQAMLGLSLRKQGYRVRLAESGATALQLLRAEKFDWLITDAAMIPMDGFQLARRAARLRPALRIVMVSADCRDEDISSSPIEKIFHKPAALDELFAWLKEKPHDASAPRPSAGLRNACRRHPGDLRQGDRP